MQHETWNIPDIVQNKGFGGRPYPKEKGFNMKQDRNNYEVSYIILYF